MKAPSTTVSDFDSCRGATIAWARRTPLSLGALVLLAVALLLTCSPAGAAEHTTVTGEYGKEGPKATGVGEGCRIAYHSASHHLYLFSDQKIYGLDRTAPGSVTPLPSPFPISGAPQSFCGDPDFEVDNSAGATSGNLYAESYGSNIFGWSSAGNALSGWPVGSSTNHCGLAIPSTGEIWSDYFPTSQVNKFSPTGVLGGTIPVGFFACKIAVDPTTNDLFVEEYGGNTTTKFTAASGYTASVGISTAGGYNPGLAVNGALGRLYVANGTSQVKAYDTTSGAVVETIDVGGIARDVTVDEPTDTLFVTVGSGNSGYIKEYLGLKAPKATTGEPIGNMEVSGTADPNDVGPITECYFEYGTNTNYEISPGVKGKQNCAESVPFNSTQPVSATLPNLLGETVHHYRLVLDTGVPNVIGRGRDKTIEPHNVNGVLTLPAEAITRTSATLKGSFEGNGEGTTYFFEYGPTAAYGSRMPIAPSEVPAGAPAGGVNPISVDVGNLTAQTVYHYRVIARNGIGASPGDDTTFETLPAVQELVTEPATEADADSATLHGSFIGTNQDTDYYFEWGTKPAVGLKTDTPPGQSAGATTGPTSLSGELTDLTPGVTYYFRVVATNDLGTTAGQVESFTTFRPPSIEALYTTNGTATSVDVNAKINPNEYQTEYFVEYGTTPAYGLVAPLPYAILAPAGTGQDAVVHLEGISPVTQHFRLVAKNEWGVTTSEDHTFDFVPPSCPNSLVRQQTGGAYLPDCRAYELVSPENVGNIVLTPNGPLGLNARDRFGYGGVFGAVPGTEPPNRFGDAGYIAVRSSTGWRTHYTGIRGFETQEGYGAIGDSTLNKFIDFRLSENPAQPLHRIPYVWDVEGNPLGRWPANFAEIPGAEETEGMFQPSPDFSHLAFSSKNVAFTQGGRTVAPGSAYDYDTSSETTALISKRPSGGGLEVDIEQEPGNTSSTDEYIHFPGPTGVSTYRGGIASVHPGVSEDGSHILMSTLTAPYDFFNHPQPPVRLYMRVNRAVTYEISRGHGVIYLGMTNDGSKVFFSSEEQLTADDHDTSADLFMWSEASDSLTRLSVGDTGGGDTDSCVATWTAKCGIGLVVSEPQTDYSLADSTGDVYFYSPEQLDGAKGIAGKRNLYLYRDGAARFVTTLAPDGPLKRTEVSADGTYAAFITASRLTAYDNAGHDEMYTYEPATKKLRCVSCKPDGTAPSADVEGSVHGLFMADNGRSFFTTEDALIPQDTNGVPDVYEFVDGRPQLISTGIGVTAGVPPTLLVGVSRDGQDVFFATVNTLVPQDRNGLFRKFYDARTNGGFLAAPPVVPCEAADECHGSGSAEPAQSVVATELGLGSTGNFVGDPRRTRRCRKGQRGVKHKGKVSCVKKKSRPRPRHQQTSRRG